MMLVDMRAVLNDTQWNRFRQHLEDRAERGPRDGQGGPPPMDRRRQGPGPGGRRP
jgi:hypothetical protein